PLRDAAVCTWLARRWARWRSVPGRAGGRGRGPRPLLPEDVLDFLAGLLEVALGLIGAALGLEGLIAGGRTEAFLGFALGRLGGVLDLVFCAHRAASLSWGAAGLWSRPRA